MGDNIEQDREETIEDRITRLVLIAHEVEGIHITVPAHLLNREMHDIEATARREERERSLRQLKEKYGYNIDVEFFVRVLGEEG